MSAEFPASGNYLSAIRESCKSLRQSSDINIETESIKRLLLSPAFTTTFKRVSANHGLALPLSFSSVLDELNLISILSLLNFASGFRAPLHAPGGPGRGAWDTIRAFVFSMYLTSATGQGDLTSAAGMVAIQQATVAELLGVNIHIEKPHPTIPAITVGELGGPLYELVKLITQTLNETGQVLDTMGYPNLGAFVVEALRESATKKDQEPSIEIVLERLVRAIPAFQDMAVINGNTVYCFKKALFLIHAINIRFGSISPPPFPIPSTTKSPIFTDNVIPSLLIHLGVIGLPSQLSSIFPDSGSPERLETLLAIAPVSSSDTTKHLPAQGPLVSNEQAFILRAAAVNACELIVQVARSIPASSLPNELLWINDITLPQLDMWIWAVAKDRKDYRELDRFSLMDTVFF